MKKLITPLLISLLHSCQSDVTDYIPFVEGYWEIVSATKDQKKIKDFKISGVIDYFKINDDLSGYRKKVTPRFDGAFEISQDQSNFKLSIEDHQLRINYNNNGIAYKEQIMRANETSLIISNSNGFSYTYKPYEPLIFD
ncbi:lipocalin family protein [Flavobacteriaceae bacterium]|nr:lipocalin family protein [Flavobacteriaceae bacterium]MDA9029495.1 lipocalin family protein [Flavobacteriaceae bacterium]